ncbi:DUF2946 family protein [Geminicoccus flavidas]|uniref:DUF2946 family protein n=1 Tax=Geminicoccus flavidas TaxID=2506407 RepID=UPI0013589D34|nr:DUF2946 family protein [Geminicoccus flavidas]
MRAVPTAIGRSAGQRLTALAAAGLFALQLLLATVGSALLAAPAAAGHLLVPICTDGHLTWIDPAAPDGGDEDPRQGGLDCAKCCPHLVNALLPPRPPRLVEVTERQVEPAPLPFLAVRAGRSTAAPPPPRGPPPSQA